MRARSVGFVLFVIVVASCTVPLLAVTAGRVDTFQDGSLLAWKNGGAQPAPTNVATGGPAGAGDRYLQVTSTNRLAVFNETTWAGDYDDAAVLDIGVDFRNPNPTPAIMRAVLFGPNGSRWSSATPATVPADGLWHHYTFSLRQADLNNVLTAPGETYAITINAVDQLMFRHEEFPDQGGTSYIGTLGIDNVTAIAIPEPSAAAAIAVAGLLSLRRRR